MPAGEDSVMRSYLTPLITVARGCCVLASGASRRPGRCARAATENALPLSQIALTLPAREGVVVERAPCSFSRPMACRQPAQRLAGARLQHRAMASRTRWCTCGTMRESRSATTAASAASGVNSPQPRHSTCGARPHGEEGWRAPVRPHSGAGPHARWRGRLRMH